MEILFKKKTKKSLLLLLLFFYFYNSIDSMGERGIESWMSPLKRTQGGASWATRLLARLYRSPFLATNYETRQPKSVRLPNYYRRWNLNKANNKLVAYFCKGN